MILSVSMLTSCATLKDRFSGDGSGRMEDNGGLGEGEEPGPDGSLWYFGADDEFHYFVHMYRESTRYRIKRADLDLQTDLAFSGYEESEMVNEEAAQKVLAVMGVELSAKVPALTALQILEVRPKENAEHWKVDMLGEQIRIRKSSSHGIIYPPGTAVEFWSKDSDDEWVAAKTA